MQKRCAIRRNLIPRMPKLNSKGLEERKEGISALVKVRNEPWVEPSILSIKNLVDEVVVVDASTKQVSKKTEKIIEKLREKEINIKYHHMDPIYRKQSAKAVEMSTRKWLLRWDADFVAYTSGERNINKLKKTISKLPNKKHYAIAFNLIDLGPDFFHNPIKSANTIQPKHFWGEDALFTYSKDLLKEERKLKKLKNMIKRIIGKKPQDLMQNPFPLYYSFKYIRGEPLGMHLKEIKPASIRKQRKNMREWIDLSEEEREEYSNSLKKFTEEKKTEEKTREMNTKRFNREKYRYPSTLKKWFEEELDLEIEETEEFEKKINKHLSEFEE